MSTYRLMELFLDGDEVVDVKVLARDLPAIIYAKYLREVKNQGFTGGK